MTQTPILEIKNISKTFDYDLFQKKQLILNDLSLIFLEGKCTALMGHNGAGKTTTIRTIFGLIKPDKGQVLFRGQPISQIDKKKIGYMPETNKLPTNLSCEEILWHQLRVFNPENVPAKQYPMLIEESLREIQLWEHRRKRVGSLSKGMGRRLSWAQALIHQPDLIILDEPMSGLDPLGHKLMASLIQKLRTRKASIILCTHELWSIQDLCDEAHILQKGRLCFSTLNPEFSARRDHLIQHKLTLSGLDASQAAQLRESQNLPTWSSIINSGHKLTLIFDDYSSAIKWLSFCINRGILIVNFQKSSQLDEQHLIKYFSEEKFDDSTHSYYSRNISPTQA